MPGFMLISLWVGTVFVIFHQTFVRCKILTNIVPTVLKISIKPGIQELFLIWHDKKVIFVSEWLLRKKKYLVLPVTCPYYFFHSKVQVFQLFHQKYSEYIYLFIYLTWCKFGFKKSVWSIIQAVLFVLEKFYFNAMFQLHFLVMYYLRHINICESVHLAWFDKNEQCHV